MTALVPTNVLCLISIWYIERVATGSLVTTPPKEFFCEGTKYFTNEKPTTWDTAHKYCVGVSAKLAKPHKVAAISRCLATTTNPFSWTGYWIGRQLSLTKCEVCFIVTGKIADQFSCSQSFSALCEDQTPLPSPTQGFSIARPQTPGFIVVDQSEPATVPAIPPFYVMRPTSHQGLHVSPPPGLNGPESHHTALPSASPQTPGFVFVDQPKTSTVPTIPGASHQASPPPGLKGPGSYSLDIHAVKFERRQKVCWSLLEAKPSQNVLHCARHCSKRQPECSGFLQGNTDKVCLLYTQPQILPCTNISDHEAVYELC